jgi:ATP-binding cassette subfamily B protein
MFLLLIVKISNKYYHLASTANTNLTTVINEAYTGSEIIRSYNLKNLFNRKFNTANNNLYKTTKKAKVYSALVSPILLVAIYLGQIVLCTVGTIFAVNQQQVSYIVIIPSFLVFIGLINYPLSNLSNQFESIQLGANYFSHIQNILDLEDEKLKTKNIIIPNQKFKGTVEFKNVNFKYDKKPILSNLNFKVKPGQKIAFVGKTGAGKTTITKLLMRFYDPTSGEIKIDNINLADLNLSHLRSLFAVVSQES